MTISSVGAGGTYTQTFTTVEARVAVLVLENEEQQQELDQELLDSARARYAAAAAEEIAALREEADHVFQGALVQGGVSVAGAGLQLVSVKAEGDAMKRAAETKVAEEVAEKGAESACDTLAAQRAAAQADGKTWGTFRSIGESASANLGPTAGRLLGDAQVARDRADAREAASELRQAEWELEDRKQALSASLADQDQAVRWLSDLVERDAASTSAVLSQLA